MSSPQERADVSLKTNDGKTPREVASTATVKTLLHDAETASTSVASHTNDPTVETEQLAVADVKGIGSSPVDHGGCATPATPEESLRSVWQVQPAALQGAWIDVGEERQALLHDATQAGITKAMFREGGRSYIVDLEAFTQTDLSTGSIRPIRLHKGFAEPIVKEMTGINERVSLAGAGNEAQRTEHQTETTELLPRQNVEVSGKCSVDPNAKDVPGISEGGGLASVAQAKTIELVPGQTVEVSGSGDKPYIVKNCGGGVWSCTCVAWKMQGKKPVQERICKHIVSVRGASACGVPNVDHGSAAASAKPAVSSWHSKADCGKVIPPPLLLANRWEEHVDPTGWWISEKLDGMRAFWDPEKGLFSRLGNQIACPKLYLESLPSAHSMVSCSWDVVASRN